MNDEEEYYRLNYFDNFLTFANETLYISKALDDTILFKLEALNNASYVIIPKREQARIENGINITERCITIKEDGTVSVEVRDRENSYQQFYLEDTDTNKFIESVSEYTEDGKFITKVIDSLGKETFYDVDPSTGLTMSITNPKEIITKYTYNTKDQVKTITSNEKTVTYDYNTQNLLSKIASGKKHYNFEYDEFLNTKKIDINGQTLVTNNFEEKNGNLLSCEYGNGNKINYTYDEFNRLKTYTASGKIYTNEYNSIGELSNVYGGSENHYYFYDFANRLSKYLLTDFTTTFEIDYNYDKNGNVTNKDYNLFSAGNHDLSSKINYEYNKDDSIVKVSFDNHSLNNTYDYLGRLEKKSIDNTLNIEYTYYGRGNKTSLIVKSVKIDDDLYEYKYDNLYNITDIYLNGELTNHYEYDMFNQLTMDMNYTLTKSYTFTYNTEGNILDKREYNLETNELLNIDTYEYSNTDWEDQLTKFNNEEISYDEIGNPLTIGDKTLTWQSGRQLKQVLNSDNTLNIMYEYNKDGIRTSKIVGQVNKTEYYLDGSNIVVEKTGNDMLYFIRDDSDNLIGFKLNGTMYYYVKNLQEDIIGIKDSEFNLVASYVYDAWGKILSVKDSNGNEVTDKNHIAHINPFRYRSYYYDDEIGFYYLNSRYYNPEWGRFINADGTIGADKTINSHNLFLYCSNNFIVSCDNTGNILAFVVRKIRKAFVKTVLAIGAKLGGVITGMTAAGGLLSTAYRNQKEKSLTPSTKVKLTKELKKSDKVNNYIKDKLSNQKNNDYVSVYNYKEMDFYDANDSKDLRNSIGTLGNIDFEAKRIEDGWAVNVKVSDRYDFSHWGQHWTFSGVMNSVGYASMKLGLLDPYDWDLTYQITIEDK